MACKFAASIQNNYSARITSFRALRGFGKTLFQNLGAAPGIAASMYIEIIDIGKMLTQRRPPVKKNLIPILPDILRLGRSFGSSVLFRVEAH